MPLGNAFPVDDLINPLIERRNWFSPYEHPEWKIIFRIKGETG
jgi:hypothetical protein